MEIAYHPNFVKQFKKLPNELQQEVLEKIDLFKKDPKSKILKNHKLKGKLRGLNAFSVNYSYRIIFEVIKKEALLLEVGNHDLYK